MHRSKYLVYMSITVARRKTIKNGQIFADFFWRHYICVYYYWLTIFTHLLFIKISQWTSASDVGLCVWRCYANPIHMFHVIIVTSLSAVIKSGCNWVVIKSQQLPEKRFIKRKAICVVGYVTNWPKKVNIECDCIYKVYIASSLIVWRSLANRSVGMTRAFLLTWSHPFQNILYQRNHPTISMGHTYIFYYVVCTGSAV